MSGGTNVGDDPDFVLDPTLSAEAVAVRLAIAYWERLRGDKFAPPRAAIDPREAKPFLSHVQIFDIIDNGRAIRVRLVGTAIATAIKEDATGQTFDDSSPRLVVQRTLKAVRWTLSNRKPLRTFAARTAVAGKDMYAHETAFLPLSSDGETVDMMLIVGVFMPGRG